MRLLLLAVLTLLIACSPEDPLPADAAPIEVRVLAEGSGEKMKVVETGEMLCCLGDVVVDQSHMASLEVVKGDAGMPEVRLTLNEAGRGVFGGHIAAHNGTRVAVVVDGDIWVAPLMLADKTDSSVIVLTIRDPTGASQRAAEVADRLRPSLGKASSTP